MAVVLRDHIHLYLDGGDIWDWSALNDGGPKRTPIQVGSYLLTLGGTIKTYRLPMQNSPEIIEFTIIVRGDEDDSLETKLTNLLSLGKRNAIYVPHEHEESPLAPLQTVFVDEIAGFSPFTSMLDRYDVQIRLIKGAINQ